MNKKIREIISHYQISDRQFAIKIGVTQSVIGSMFQKNTEPSAKVIKLTLAAFPEISAEWFIRDKGPMFTENKEAERISKLVDTIETLQGVISDKNQTIAQLTEENRRLRSKAD